MIYVAYDLAHPNLHPAAAKRDVVLDYSMPLSVANFAEIRELLTKQVAEEYPQVLKLAFDRDTEVRPVEIRIIFMMNLKD